MLIHLQERKNLISNSAIFGSRQHELRGALCRPKVFNKIFETIINDLVDFSSSFENGTCVMSQCVYGHYQYFNSFSAGTVFIMFIYQKRRQILTRAETCERVMVI